MPEINEVSALQEQDDISVANKTGSRNNSKNNRFESQLGTPTFNNGELKKLNSRKESDKSLHEARYDKHS